MSTVRAPVLGLGERRRGVPARRARRRAGLAFYALGGVLFVYAGWRYGSAFVAREQARAKWAASTARAEVVRARRAALPTVGVGAPAVLGAPVARLLIPRLGLDEIVIEGVGARELNVGPGHLPGSPLPGESGNSIISAHRDRQFHGLDKLAVGDTAYTETQQLRATWVVTRRRIVDRETPALFSTPGPTLTLTTCWPVRYIGPAPDRLIVTATPVRVTPR